MQELVRQIIASTSQPELSDNVLDEFNATFKVGASALYSVHVFEEMRGGFAWSSLWRGQEAEHLRKIVENGQDEEDRAAYEFMMKAPAQIAHDETALFGVKSYKDLPASSLRDIVTDFGVPIRVPTVLNKSGPWFDGLFVQARNEQEGLRYRQDERSKIIFPLISNSLSLGRTFAALRAQYNQALAVLDKLGLGVLLVDRCGTVIHANDEAERILDQCDGLGLSRERRLKISNSDLNAQLETMVASAFGLTVGEIEKPKHLMSIPRLSGKYDFLVSVLPLDDSAGELESGFHSAFVTLIDPSRDTSLSTEGLNELGGLSAAESEIAKHLVDGFRLNEISERRGVSLATVKTQLQSISLKLRCSSQSDIIRVAAATRIPIKK